MRTKHDLPLSPPSDAERDRMFREIEEGKARLHPIEVEIVAGLQARPAQTWCLGCTTLLYRIHAKALAQP